MKKLSTIFILAGVMLLVTACSPRSAPTAESSIAVVSESEAAPKKPTAADAAKHNEAIGSENIRLIQLDDPDTGDEIAVISTTEGDIKVRLFVAQAPETVAAFKKLAEEGHYNGGKFAEAVEGYKIDGAGKPDYIVFPKEEFSLDLWNFYGAVAVSNNGSNFMIVTASHCLNPKTELDGVGFPEIVTEKYLEVGGAPHQDWKNTVFGQVVQGMDVAEKISMTKDGETAAINAITIEIAA